MLYQADSKRLFPAGYFGSMQQRPSIPAPLSGVCSLVALISHDLRQPLTAILANAEFLTRTDISEVQRGDFYQEIHWAIDRMDELVSSLLEMSKGRDTLRPAAGNIVDAIGHVVRMISVNRSPRHHHRASS